MLLRLIRNLHWCLTSKTRHEHFPELFVGKVPADILSEGLKGAVSLTETEAQVGRSQFDKAVCVKHINSRTNSTDVY
jgi:hypothetical protein